MHTTFLRLRELPNPGRTCERGEACYFPWNAHSIRFGAKPPHSRWVCARSVTVTAVLWSILEFLILIKMSSSSVYSSVLMVFTRSLADYSSYPIHCVWCYFIPILLTYLQHFQVIHTFDVFSEYSALSHWLWQCVDVHLIMIHCNRSPMVIVIAKKKSSHSALSISTSVLLGYNYLFPTKIFTCTTLYRRQSSIPFYSLVRSSTKFTPILIYSCRCCVKRPSPSLSYGKIMLKPPENIGYLEKLQRIFVFIQGC